MFGETTTTSKKSFIDKYLKWKGASDTGYFTYYNKDKGAEEKYDLKEFILLDTQYSIMGWSDEFSKPIYSNRINKFDEEFNVRAGEMEIVKGIYKDIKGDLAGGKLFVNYVGLIGDEVVNIPLKGLAFFDSTEIVRNINTNSHKVKLLEVKEGKKGAVKFKTPVFGEGSKIKDEEADIAKSIVNEMKGSGVTIDDVSDIF